MMSTFRKGDKVSISAVVTSDDRAGRDFVDVAIGDEYGKQVFVDKSHVHVVEPALQPGDMVLVKCSTDWIEATVRGVHLDSAWLDLGHGENLITPLSTVKRIDLAAGVAEAA